MRTLPLALFFAACTAGVSEIDDPQMEATAKSIGDQSGSLANQPSDADESTMQGQAITLGSSFQGLVGQHQAYAATNGVVGLRRDTLHAEGDPTYSWDGTNLVLRWEGADSGYSISYDLDLTIAAAGDGKSIEGTYALDYSLDVGGVGYDYVIDVAYQAMTFDAAGCAVSGGIDLSYSIDLAVAGLDVPGFSSGATSGRVVTAFDGCGVVTVSGS